MQRRALGTSLAVAMILLLAAWWLSRPLVTSRPDVLLITVDTLRADALAIQSREPRRTPAIQRLAERSTVFTRATSPMPLTRPAHFSILTGRYPREHGVMNNAMSLPEEAHTLTERLAEVGYATAAFTAVKLLRPQSGSAQGFEVFEAPDRPREIPAQQVVEPALAWLRGVAPERPVFLWVHLFDPHQPYRSPPAGPDAAGRKRGWHWKTLDAVATANGGNIPAAVLEEVRGAYQAEVEYTDAWVGRLLEGFEAQRAGRDPLIVLTADHGECFENGIYFEHADCLFEGALQVPLVLHQPGQQVGGRADARVSLVDVAPTILASLGLRARDMTGRNLSATDADGQRAVLVQNPFMQSNANLPRARTIRSVAGNAVRPVAVGRNAVGLIAGEWKYVEAGETRELYRAPAPPEGERNLAAEQPEVADRMQRRLQELLDELPQRVHAPEQINPELRETLRALGYVE